MEEEEWRLSSCGHAIRMLSGRGFENDGQNLIENTCGLVHRSTGAGGHEARKRTRKLISCSTSSSGASQATTAPFCIHEQESLLPCGTKVRPRLRRGITALMLVGGPDGFFTVRR